MTLLEQNPKLGFYMVGDQRHYVKPQALIAGTQSNQFPEWNFNDEVFGIDWCRALGRMFIISQGHCTKTAILPHQSKHRCQERRES